MHTVARTARALAQAWFWLMVCLGLRMPGRVTFHGRFIRMAGRADEHAFWPDDLRDRLKEKTR